MLIAITHPVMRRLILELLNREQGSWAASLLDDDLAPAILALRPDLVILDSADLRHFGSDGLIGFSRKQIVVVGPEPDVAYLNAALGRGAGAWVARDELADQLGPAMRRALAQRSEPIPGERT